MISAELNKMLIYKFPCLKERYLDEVGWQEGDNTGSHVVYGDVLTPYLRDCMLKEHWRECQAIFDYLEELLSLQDKYADEVVYFSVLEGVAYIFKEKFSLISYLGERCKKALSDIYLSCKDDK